MNTLHKWIYDPAGDKVSVSGPPACFATHNWECARCGARVWAAVKPKHKRHLRRLGINANCSEELVRQVLET